MKALIDSFIDLPAYQRILAAVGVVAVCFGGFFYMFLEPLEAEISKAETEISTLDREILKRTIKARKLNEFKEEVERLDAQLAQALKELPDKSEIGDLLSNISDKAKESGLDVLKFNPEPEEKKDFYASVPVSLELQGSYHEVASFFDEIAHLERIVNMTQFRIAVDERIKDFKELLINVTATSFRFLDPSERPTEDDKKKKRRRRRRKR